MSVSNRAVMEAVRRRLADEPDRVLPALRVIADTDALVDDGDDTTISLARTANTHRVVALLRELRARAFTTTEVCALLGGVSRQAVSLRVGNHRLLAVEISKRLHFPDWQFGPDGVLGGVPAVVAALRDVGKDGLAADALMRTPLPEESGRTPADLLAAGDVDRVSHYVRVLGGGF